MLIAIPSRARATQRNHTYDNLPKALQERAMFFVPQAEVPEYRDRFGVDRVTGLRINGIGKVRERIIDIAHTHQTDQKVVMLDDDLSFFKRRADDPTKLVQCIPESVKQLFTRIQQMLDKYAHVGVAAREGANRCVDDYMFNTRMLRVLAYDAGIMKSMKVRYDRLPVMEDFDVTLQLLRKGFGNCVINGWAQDQGTSNAPGGCSTYRTADVQASGALGLKKLHPDFVRVVTKETKGAWGGGERTDVVISWKKAFEEGTR